MTDTINLPATTPSSVEVHFGWSPSGTYSYTAPNGIAFASPSVVAGTSTTFTATTTIANQGIDISGPLTITEYRWDFGDGTIGYGNPCTHTYKVGNLSAQTVLRVTDSQGRRWYCRQQMYISGNKNPSLPATLSLDGKMPRLVRTKRTASLSFGGSLSAFKPNGVGLVGSVGARSAANSPVTPVWGTGSTQTAGNLLVCWVQINTNNLAGLATPSGWSTLSSLAYCTTGTGNHGSVVIFYKIAAGGDAAPTLTDSGRFIYAQLAEFSGIATTSPVDQTGSSTANATTSTQTATAASADAAAGELIVYAAGATYSATPTGASMSTSLNNGATAHDSTLAGTTVTSLAFGYGITTGNSGADQVTEAVGTTTGLLGAGVTFGSFLR